VDFIYAQAHGFGPRIFNNLRFFTLKHTAAKILGFSDLRVFNHLRSFPQAVFCLYKELVYGYTNHGEIPVIRGDGGFWGWMVDPCASS
jgi:hypothetical protein